MPSARGVIADLAQLSDLSDEIILEELRARYDTDAIYTYIGDILISLNPNKQLPIYGEQIGQQYGHLLELREMAPHAYAIATRSYRNLMRSKVNQCILVSGESGAGKTECTKMMIAQVVRMSKSERMGNLHQKIVEVNPLLEAFGNAQTVLNKNSSRFGKLIELEFTEDGVLQGARITEHMLEKSRVVHTGPGERSFHIFYYMFAGLTEREKHRYFLGRPEKFRIVDPAHRMPVFTSKMDFDVNMQAMFDLKNIIQKMGFSEQMIELLFAILAGILHLCNVDFAEDPELRQVIILNEEAVDYASRLLSVQADDMVNILLSITAFVRGERMVRLKSVVEACDGRDALARALYSRLFSWIVQYVNRTLGTEGFNSRNTRGIVGLLDMAGFENFPVNSFEQLCINIANEQLQFYFNSYIFTWELGEYQEEGIKPPKIKFTNNKDILNLFLKRPLSILSTLEDECRLQPSTDLGLVEKLDKQFSKHPNYKKSKERGTVFTVIHYAGQVQYTADGFIEKNRETLGQNFISLMENSHNRLVNELFLGQITGTGTLQSEQARSRDTWIVPQWNKPNIPTLGPGETLSKRAGKKIKEKMKERPLPERPLPEVPRGNITTASQTFRNSLSTLMGNLSKAEPHFVRCIKPNNEQQYGFFDDKLVMNQLRSTGVLETTKIRRLGYPKRMFFKEFIHRYQFIAFDLTKRVELSSITCLHIANRAGISNCEVGQTKVFLKYWQLDQLESIKEHLIHDVIIAQKTVRMHLCRKWYLRLQEKRYQQRDEVFILGKIISKAGDKVFHMMTSTNDYNKSQYQKEIAERRRQQARQHISRSQQNYHYYNHGQNSRYRDYAYDNNNDIYEHPDYDDPNSSPYRTRRSTNRIYHECLSQVIERRGYLDPDAWCKIFYLEYDKVVAKFYILEKEVTIDGSYEEFDGDRIGLAVYRNEQRTATTETIRTHIGKGVKLRRDPDGSIRAIRLGKNPIIVKGADDPARHCFSVDIIECGGKLPLNQPAGIFDMEEMKSQMGLMLQQPMQNIDKETLQLQSIAGLSFIRDEPDDAQTPCWLIVINIRAIQAIDDPDVLSQVQQKIVELSLKTEDDYEKEAEMLQLAKRNDKRRWSKFDQRQGVKGKQDPLRKTRLELMQHGISVKDRMSYSWEIELQNSKKKQKNINELQNEYSIEEDYIEPMSIIGGYKHRNGPRNAPSMLSSAPYTQRGSESQVKRNWAKIRVALREEKIEETVEDDDAKIRQNEIFG